MYKIIKVACLILCVIVYSCSLGYGQDRVDNFEGSVDPAFLEDLITILEEPGVHKFAAEALAERVAG